MYYLQFLRSWQPYFLLWQCFIKLIEGNPNYDNFLIDTNVCSAIDTQRLTIESDTAINMTLTLGERYFISYRDVRCHYRLEPSSQDSGIIAIIQELSLRKKKGNCRDHIQFTMSGKQSKEFCGSLDAREVMTSASQTFTAQADDVTFIGDIGAINVTIFISKEVMHERLKINMIFTSFKVCYHNSKYHKPCLKNRNICIHENFFLDGVVNCPFYHCLDENGCNNEITKNTDFLSNRILIGSVTSLLLIFLIFILCLYICRKHGKLCWSDQFANPNGTIPIQSTRVMELEETPNQSQNTRSSAPVSSEQDDKDLPPSYESLFPRR